MKITGSTQVFTIIGDPISQVRAPEVFNHVFEKAGINAVLVPAWVAEYDLCSYVSTAFAAKNFGGMLVTIPHKGNVLPYLARCDRLSQVAGAVNGIRRAEDGQLEGGFFDGLGFVGSLEYYGIPYAGKKILIIGAGGSASAIAASLADRGAGEIALFDPVAGKAAELASRVRNAFAIPVFAAEDNRVDGFDLVVNATPLGMSPDDPMPVDVSRLAPNTAIVDILMKNQPTPLVRAARAMGRVAEPGFEMLIQQTPFYLEFFGYPEVAAQVRTDAASIRRLIYPPELL